MLHFEREMMAEFLLLHGRKHVGLRTLRWMEKTLNRTSYRINAK